MGTELFALILITGGGTVHGEHDELTIHLYLLQIERTFIGDGVSNLSPWCDNLPWGTLGASYHA